MVIVVGLIMAPIPAAFKGEPAMIQRAMYALPFAALLAGFGVVRLWHSRFGRTIALFALLTRQSSLPISISTISRTTSSARRSIMTRPPFVMWPPI